jgi:GNAT superfamily N-acetyltransferase
MPPPLGAAAALGISYRPAGEGDLPLLSAVYASTRAEELAPLGWPDEIKQQFLAHQFNAQHVDYERNFPDAERLLIVRDGEDIGRLYIIELSDHVLVMDIALLPPWRGLGIGAAIFADIKAQARAASKPIRIHVEKNNPARHLYDRLGFATIEDAGIYDLLEWRTDEAETPQD